MPRQVNNSCIGATVAVAWAATVGIAHILFRTMEGCSSTADAAGPAMNTTITATVTTTATLFPTATAVTMSCFPFTPANGSDAWSKLVMENFFLLMEVLGRHLVTEQVISGVISSLLVAAVKHLFFKDGNQTAPPPPPPPQTPALPAAPAPTPTPPADTASPLAAATAPTLAVIAAAAPPQVSAAGPPEVTPPSPVSVSAPASPAISVPTPPSPVVTTAPPSPAAAPLPPPQLPMPMPPARAQSPPPPPSPPIQGLAESIHAVPWVATSTAASLDGGMPAEEPVKKKKKTHRGKKNQGKGKKAGQDEPDQAVQGEEGPIGE